MTSAERTVAQVAPPVATAVVHYLRPAGDYDDWGLHLWGDAIAAGVATDWAAPRQRTAAGEGWARFERPVADVTKPVNLILHRPGGGAVPETQEPGGDRSFVPATSPEIWLEQGDPSVYATQPATG